MAKQKLPKLPPLPGAADAGRNVLFFHHGGLGDFVLTWPILLGAARVMAQSRVLAIVGEDRGKLAEAVLRVECRDVENGWSALYGNRGLPERPMKLLTRTGHVISFVAPPGSAWEQSIRRHAPDAKVTMLVPPPRDLAGQHAIDYLLSQLSDEPMLQAGTLGIVESIGKTGLMPRLHDPKGPLVLHVGSGSSSKNWPISSWIDLAGKLREKKRRVRVVLGEAEQERVSAYEMTVLAEVADVQTPKDLSELLFLLRGSGAFIGHDSGPTHLAAMCGLPTHAIFGPASDPAVWGPVGPRVTTGRTDDLDALEADLVASDVRQLLA